MSRLPRTRTTVALLALLLAAAACREGPGARRLVDGGRFELPDSGVFFDARPAPTQPDAAPPDTGPYVCAGGCPDGSVCGCLGEQASACGCHAPQGYNAACDPQHEETCGWPYQCVRGRKLEGLRYICSDGREGSSCSTQDSICNTSRGCICSNTVFGTACSCQGDQGPNPLLCDPRNPASCPGGTCVRIETTGGVTHLCSQGRQYEPCNPGDSTCHTTLGCTCPLYEGRPACQCSEPGGMAGELCDPRVAGACAAGLDCAVIRGEQPGAFTTECTGSLVLDGGVDPRTCDPVAPQCPPLFECAEVRPGTFRCVPQS